jgi:alpha-2-macroglobulin
VLKPDVAQTLYGAQGANGVILITTSKKNSDALSTGKEGEPVHSLRRHFRDDAYWQPSLKTDASGKVRFTTTFPDDITNWRTFAIAMGGQKQTGSMEGLIRSFRPVSANVALPQFALEGDNINAIGKVLNYGSDSLLLTRMMRVNDSLVKQGQIHILNALLDTISVVIPPLDSLKVRIEIKKQDGYFDGEERVIPVYKRGTLETKGFFAALEGDTALTIQLDPALGTVTLFAEASLLPILLDETEKVRRYPYLCNEQLASKLKALLAQKQIYQLMEKSFDKDKSIMDIIGRLQNSRTGYLWGWWINNEPAPWITLHVAEALLQAEKGGYKITLPKAALIDNLIFNMEHYRNSDKLLTLQLLKQLGAKADYTGYIDTLAKSFRSGTLYDQLRLAALQQAEGLPFSIDSILAAPKKTLFGNLYWGEEGYRLFDNSIQNTLLVYRILKAKGGHEATLAKIRNYFLEKRKDGQWRNTYESSLILETILPDLAKEGNSVRPAMLRFTDQPDEVVSQFPFQKEVTGNSPIRISKSGDLPLYFTAYQQQWNKTPAAVAEAFQVHSYFEKNKRAITALKAGEPVILQVDILVKGDADYVMIEIPIPAGCSYKDKPQPRLNNEVHREYFKDKVSIFCRSLKQGSYSFKVSLLPRYTGMYHLNPAKAEMMYFPVFYGREALKTISIK